MIPYQLPKSGRAEQELWKDSLKLGAGEMFALGVAHSFERENTLGLALEEGRITDAEVEAGTHDPDFGVAGENYDDMALPEDVWEVRGVHAFAMSEEQYKASEWYRARPDGKAAIDYTPNMTPQRARILAEVFDRRQHEKLLLEKSADSFGRKALLFGASFLAQLPDPINFVPVGGAAARGTRLGLKAARGALEGAVSTALTDALLFPVANARGEDFTFLDAALDITFGAAIGGGIGYAGGKLGQWREQRTAAEIDGMGREFSAALEEAGLPVEDAALAARRVIESLKDAPGGLAEARRLRQSLGGQDRLVAGRAMEKALLDVAAGDAADVRLVYEQLAAGRAFDQVAQEIAEGRAHRLSADELLFAIRPEDIEGLLVQRGPSIMGDAGEIRVTGRRLKREKGSAAGYGLVKVEVSHPEVTRSDVMSLPRIIREYEPSAFGPDGRREWRVPADDGSGRHLLVAEGRTPDGQGTLVSMYRYKPGEAGRGPGLSQKRSAPAESLRAGFQPEPRDTDGGLPDRLTRSQQGQNAPERSGIENIDAMPVNVKDLSPARTLPEYRAPKPPKGLEGELAALGIDQRTGQSIDELEALRLAGEGRADETLMADLEAARLENERVSELEEISLSLVPCIIGGI